MDVLSFRWCRHYILEGLLHDASGCAMSQIAADDEMTVDATREHKTALHSPTEGTACWLL
jgi:hypothetical protein